MPVPAFAERLVIYEGFSCGMETKIFGEPRLNDRTLVAIDKSEGVRRMRTAKRKPVLGSPDLASLITSHIERVFLSVRQELKRFQRKGLGYSKDLATHKAAVALFLGVCNFVRKHTTLQPTPGVAAGVEVGSREDELHQGVQAGGAGVMTRQWPQFREGSRTGRSPCSSPLD